MKSTSPSPLRGRHQDRIKDFKENACEKVEKEQQG
jgi:hypothetical protein